MKSEPELGIPPVILNPRVSPIKDPPIRLRTIPQTLLPPPAISEGAPEVLMPTVMRPGSEESQDDIDQWYENALASVMARKPRMADVAEPQFQGFLPQQALDVQGMDRQRNEVMDIGASVPALLSLLGMGGTNAATLGARLTSAGLQGTEQGFKSRNDAVNSAITAENQLADKANDDALRMYGYRSNNARSQFGNEMDAFSSEIAGLDRQYGTRTNAILRRESERADSENKARTANRLEEEMKRREDQTALRFILDAAKMGTMSDNDIESASGIINRVLGTGGFDGAFLSTLNPEDAARINEMRLTREQRGKLEEDRHKYRMEEIRLRESEATKRNDADNKTLVTKQQMAASARAALGSGVGRNLKAMSSTLPMEVRTQLNMVDSAHKDIRAIDADIRAAESGITGIMKAKGSYIGQALRPELAARVKQLEDNISLLRARRADAMARSDAMMSGITSVLEEAKNMRLSTQQQGGAPLTSAGGGGGKPSGGTGKPPAGKSGGGKTIVGPNGTRIRIN